MKEKKIKQKENKINKNLETEKPERKIWKLISIISIMIFSLILVLGLIRIYHFNSLFHKTAKENIDSINSVKLVVYDYMITNSRNISMDNIKTFERVREIDFNNSERKLIGVSVKEGSNEDFFLIDVDSKEIMMHSQTEFFGWLNNSKSRFLQFSKEQRRR